MTDPLDRFVDAQQASWAQALAELHRGRKTSHWMWYVFPQLAGLGRSSTAQFFGIRGPAEARAYLAHPLLGPRLIEAMAAVAAAPGSAVSILGGIDAIKLRSSATLFAAVADDPAPFRRVLDRFYDGERDPETMRLLGQTPS